MGSGEGRRVAQNCPTGQTRADAQSRVSQTTESLFILVPVQEVKSNFPIKYQAHLAPRPQNIWSGWHINLST